ncbi:uncharacterized protein LOC128729678 [Anopheles nili]|uniref:uncharacterized protein LOC128729678 n=1 Tax=Anopheles nili TaxID=185578 RepID=UPI00237A4AEE|nr:uncharacterized protein LOC128729678 [Anopheles nili]
MYILERLRKAMRRRINRRCRDPIEQHMIVVSFINNIAGLIGMHVFSADYSATNPLFVVVLIDVFLFFCVNLYTLIISFGDLVNFMFCFETILYAGIAFIKIDVFVRHYKTIHELNHFLIEFNRRYRHDPEQRELLMSNTVDLWLLIAVFNICTFVAPILIFSYSLVWTVTIDYVLPFGFLLPTIGFDYFRGFVMNYLFQLLEACLLVPGLMGAMTSIMMFLMNACLQIDMLQLELKRLSKFCAANIDGQHTVEIRKRIHEIIDHHIEHLVYIKKVCSLFELHFFVVLGCIFCQLVSIVVVVVKIDMLQLELKRLGNLCTENSEGQQNVEIRKSIHEIIQHHIEHLV